MFLAGPILNLDVRKASLFSFFCSLPLSSLSLSVDFPLHPQQPGVHEGLRQSPLC